MTLTRRGFLGGLLAAPAVGRAPSLMPVKRLPPLGDWRFMSTDEIFADIIHLQENIAKAFGFPSHLLFGDPGTGKVYKPFIIDHQFMPGGLVRASVSHHTGRMVRHGALTMSDSDEPKKTNQTIEEQTGFMGAASETPPKPDEGQTMTSAVALERAFAMLMTSSDAVDQQAAGVLKKIRELPVLDPDDISDSDTQMTQTLDYMIGLTQ